MNNSKKDILIKLKNDSINYKLNLELGLLYVKEKNYIEAKKIFEKLIYIDEKKYEGYLNLSNILILLNKHEDTELILKKFIKKNEYNKDIISSLGSHYYNIKDFKKLSQLVDKYIDLEINYLLIFFKSSVYENEKKIIKQKEYLIKTIKNKNNFWPAYEKLFNLYEKTNKIDEFNKLIFTAKKLFHNNIKIHYYSALCLFRNNEINSSLQELEQNKIEKAFLSFKNTTYLVNYYDLKSKIYLKSNNYNLCLSYAIKRNSTSIRSQNNKKFNKNILLNTIKKYSNFYTSSKKSINSETSNLLFHENLVFLVGFPRSGTTLLDSILRSHSKTHVIEEKPFLLNIRHEYFKNHTLEELSQISHNNIIKLQKKYFELINYTKNKIIIDKFPLNLIELSFIKKVFPNSKIILALRHPLDSILSCVLTSFKINEAMANYENLETAAFFYNEVFKLFTVYKNVFNFSLYQIKYENIVENFNDEIKKLLLFLELEFEESVKNYHLTAKNRDKINTPSYHQVVKPIYKDSINRYKKFNEIDKVRPIIKDWIQKFNY